MKFLVSYKVVKKVTQSMRVTFIMIINLKHQQFVHLSSTRCV